MTRLVGRAVEKMLIGAFALAMVSLVFSSCEKDTPPKAEITVVDSLGTAVQNARVILHCIQRSDETRSCNVADTQYTDQVGKTLFEFENPAVLKIDVWKEDVVTINTGSGLPGTDSTLTVGDTLCAEAFITLEINETIEQRMILTNCNKE
ncbi:hypothetical protein KFE98_06355 [bacterium SCSIO 12741]|nr:hypothetical protein KFE98_06355 [bacterium SCSIO 12741]